MSITISEGQLYVHQNGDEFEVLNVSKTGVTFGTSDDEVVYMKLPELIENVENDVLVLRDEENEDVDDQDADEDEDEDEEKDD